MSMLRSRIPGPGGSQKVAPAAHTGPVKSHSIGDQHRSKATEWANQQLRSSGFEGEIEDLIRDITDGVNFPNLVQCLMSAKVPGIGLPPRNEFERRKNIQESFSFLENHGINLEGVPCKDVIDRKPNAVMDLMRHLMQMGISGRGINTSVKGLTTNGNMNDELNGKRPSGLRRPTTPTATFSSSVQPKSAATSGLNRPSNLPSLSSPASSGPSSPASMSPNMARLTPSTSPKSGAVGTSASSAGHLHPGQNSQNSSSPGNSPGLKKSPGATTSRLATQTKKASDVNSPTVEKQEFPQGIPRASGLKGPSTRFRQSSPPTASQPASGKNTSVIGNNNDQGRTKGIPRSPSVPRRSYDNPPPDPGSKRENWNRNDRSVSEVPSSKLVNMRGAKLGIVPQGMRSPHNSQLQQPNLKGVSSLGGVGGSSVTGGYNRTTPSGIASPTSRHRNYSEGSNMKHNVLVKRTSELQAPKIATERQQQQQQQLVMKTQDDDVKTKGKLSGISKNLFGAFGHKGVSKKRSNELNEGKTLNSPQKVESRTIGEPNVESEPSVKATSKAEMPKDTSQTTLTTSLSSSPSSSSTTTTTTTTTTTDEPVKALLYTSALDDTPSDGDDDGTHSMATGSTIKGGPCSPSSIGDLSTLDSLPPSVTNTSECDGNRTKPDEVKEGEGLSEKSEKVLPTEGDKSLLECPASPKSLDVLGGERLSPDGGLGSPKSTKDDSDTLPTDTKTTTTDTKTTTTDTNTTTTDTTTTTKERVPESTVSPKIPTDPVMTKGPLSSPHALVLPVTTRSIHPHVRPQVPKTSSRVAMEARYHIGGLNKPSPLTCSDKKPHSEPVSPSGMGMKLGTNSSQEVLHSKSVNLRRRDSQRRHSPSSEGTALNPSVASLKAMHRMSRSMGEALDQLSNMDVNDPSSIIFNSAPTSARVTPLNTPSELNKVLQNDSDSDSDEFTFTGDMRRELSSSPTSSALSTDMGLSQKEPRGRSFTTIGLDHKTSNPAHSPTVVPHPPRKFSIEDKGIIDATGTLPRGAKIRRSFNVKQKWKDDMQTGNGSEDTGRSDHGLEEEIYHWKKVAESLQQQLSTTRFDLDKKGKILNMYETDYATLAAKLQNMEVALEEKTKVAELVHKNSSTSLDTVSLCEGEDDIFKEKGKKKKKGWKGFGLKLGKKGNQESDLLQRKPEVLVSMESADSSGELNKKKWSSKENLLAEITNLREQLTHLQQQNIELKRRSLSPREGLVSSNQSPNRTPSRPRSYEIDHPLLEFVDMEEGVPVPIVLHDEFRTGKDQKCNTFIGCVNVHDKTTWDDMDCKILAIFKHHVWSIDPEEGMGLVDNSICTYSFMGNWRDIGEPKPPPEDPLSLTSKPNPHVVVYLKGVRQRSSDLLAYQLLLNVSLVDSYVDMILKNRWLVLMGAKGSFKTKMANHMVRFLSNKLFGVPNKYVTFSMDTDGTQISSVLEWFQSNVENPQTHIVLVDGVFECNGVEQILNAASLMETKPYLLITIAQAHSRGSSLHSLMFRFPVRMISCTPQSEPVSHVLPRQLRKQFMELKAHRKDNIDSSITQLIHWLPRLLDYLNSVIVKFHSATVALGPAIFLPCPLHLAPYDLEHWFISQWNHFIAPYVRGSVMAGVESHGLPFGAEWKDPREWILDTYPWTDSKNKDKLQNITDEDVGLNHAIRISPQASITASTYASSVIDQDIQSMVDVQSNLS